MTSSSPCCPAPRAVGEPDLACPRTPGLPHARGASARPSSRAPCASNPASNCQPRGLRAQSQACLLHAGGQAWHERFWDKPETGLPQPQRGKRTAPLSLYATTQSSGALLLMMLEVALYGGGTNKGTQSTAKVVRAPDRGAPQTPLPEPGDAAGRARARTVGRRAWSGAGRRGAPHRRSSVQTLTVASSWQVVTWPRSAAHQATPVTSPASPCPSARGGVPGAVPPARPTGRAPGERTLPRAAWGVRARRHAPPEGAGHA